MGDFSFSNCLSCFVFRMQIGDQSLVHRGHNCRGEEYRLELCSWEQERLVNLRMCAPGDRHSNGIVCDYIRIASTRLACCHYVNFLSNYLRLTLLAMS